MTPSGASPQPVALAHTPPRLAVLLSGSGTTLQNLADHIAQGSLNATIATVIASNSKAFGLTRAKNLGLPTQIVDRKTCKDRADFSDLVFNHIRHADADLVCLAGFLCLLQIPDEFADRVINIHPALLPSFGGPGMFGHHVHQAVLNAGCKVSGCTVHFADQTYDTGPIIVQRTCPVLEGDTADTLAARVFKEECLAYPQAINLIASGRVAIQNHRTHIAGE